MKFFYYFFLIFSVNLHVKADSLNNPYVNECSSVASLNECKRYLSCRLSDGTPAVCLNNNLKSKPDASYLITPDAEEIAHQKALRDARNKIQGYVRNNAGRLCSKTVVMNGKIVTYVMAPF
jgi:hypothetical protein